MQHTFAPSLTRHLHSSRPRTIAASRPLHTPPFNTGNVKFTVKAITASLDVPSTSGRVSGTEAELRTLWDSIESALLRVGRKGPTEPQIRSLKDLLQAHTLVKVKVNGTPDAEGIGRQLEEATQSTLLQCKGNTLLFAHPDVAMQELQEKALELAQRQERRDNARQADREDPLEELDTVVRDKLTGLYTTGILERSTLDRKALRALGEISPEAALVLLAPFNKTYLRNIRNPSAWLMAQCGSVKDQLAQGKPFTRAAVPAKREMGPKNRAPRRAPARKGRKPTKPFGDQQSTAE